MLIKRDLHTKIQPFIKSEAAIVITGMRRVGKTTLLQMIFDEIQSSNKIFFDLEDPLNQKLFSVDSYEQIITLLKEQGINTSQKTYVFLDEIQSLPHLPSLVKYLIDHYQIKFFLSGSASFYIKNLFSESLSDRKYIFELYPFNFQEFLRAKNISLPAINSPQKLTDYQFTKYSHLFDEYLKYGGFPGVVLTDSYQEKIQKIKNIFSAYWSLEVEKLSDFRKKDKVRDFIFLLMERVGSKIDISKLSKELGVAKDTIASYLEFFRDTYLISTIPPYSTNRDVEIRGAKKLYFIDTGLLNQFSRLDQGSIFENNIFNLLRHHGEVKYWQQKDGQEIDFIVNDKIAYEVKLRATEQDLKTLTRRAKKISFKKYYLISKKYSNTPQTTYGFLL